MIEFPSFEQAKAWYDGGPPQGGQVQAVLDTFARDGFRYAAVASSGAMLAA